MDTTGWSQCLLAAFQVRGIPLCICIAFGADFDCTWVSVIPVFQWSRDCAGQYLKRFTCKWHGLQCSAALTHQLTVSHCKPVHVCSSLMVSLMPAGSIPTSRSGKNIVLIVTTARSFTSQLEGRLSIVVCQPTSRATRSCTHPTPAGTVSGEHLHMHKIAFSLVLAGRRLTLMLCRTISRAVAGI